MAYFPPEFSVTSRDDATHTININYGSVKNVDDSATEVGIEISFATKKDAAASTLTGSATVGGVPLNTMSFDVVENVSAGVLFFLR